RPCRSPRTTGLVAGALAEPRPRGDSTAFPDLWPLSPAPDRRAPRSGPRRRRAARGRSGRAPRRAPRASAPRRGARRRSRGGGRSPPAPSGPPRRSLDVLDAGAEAALGQLDVDALAGLEPAAG